MRVCAYHTSGEWNFTDCCRSVLSDHSQWFDEHNVPNIYTDQSEEQHSCQHCLCVPLSTRGFFSWHVDDRRVCYRPYWTPFSECDVTIWNGDAIQCTFSCGVEVDRTQSAGLSSYCVREAVDWARRTLSVPSRGSVRANRTQLTSRAIDCIRAWVTSMTHDCFSLQADVSFRTVFTNAPVLGRLLSIPAHGACSRSFFRDLVRLTGQTVPILLIGSSWTRSALIWSGLSDKVSRVAL